MNADDGWDSPAGLARAEPAAACTGVRKVYVVEDEQVEALRDVDKQFPAGRLTAIVGPSGPIILDTGFDAAMGKKRQRELLKPVGEGLQAIGIDAAQVATVIVSHMHYDHVGNYDLFPRARYHLQDCEMAYATGPCMCHLALRMPFEADDVVAMVRKVFAGRVAFHDGEDEIAGRRSSGRGDAEVLLGDAEDRRLVEGLRPARSAAGRRTGRDSIR